MNSKKLVFIYDLDGTLEDGFITDNCMYAPNGINGVELWLNSLKIAKEKNADPFLYHASVVAQTIRKLKPIDMPIEDFYAKHIDKVNLFAGVEEWFDKINQVGKNCGYKIEHFIISASVKGLISALPFANKITGIFASDFIYDENGFPVWLSNYVSSTSKTEYVYRISKGSFESFDTQKVLQKQDRSERYVTFDNIIYFGDGETDIPAMKVVKRKGGKSIAVYKDGEIEKAQKLFNERRVDAIALADYRENSQLFHFVEEIIKSKGKNENVEKK